ncbi:MAG: chorismate-binding protein [Rickettsiales bacterium]|nr:chorismate-binding protein [Rickettsiales bacterium]
MPKIKLKWQNPLTIAEKISAKISDESWILLYSALNQEIKKSISYIGLFAEEKIISDNFSEAEKIIKNSDKKWFGYLSYEVASDFEKLPKSPKSFINLPKIWLINFAVILEFNHSKKTIYVNYTNKTKLAQSLKFIDDKIAKNKFKSKKFLTKVKNISSNFSNESYLKAISDIKKKIIQGDFYQTNLTRKFFGEFEQKLNHKNNFELFLRLTKSSPANYSAFFKFDENYIISSSPELFLYAKNQFILSRPIKGTSARATDLKQDQKNKLFLKKSNKERAENLMIVDLVRNDLARICNAGSVKVRKLFAINSYENVHHMSSEIYGKIAKNFCAFDAIKTCFPAGSMTGAPKIKAMEFAAKKENINRGVYSGSLGIFAKNEINSSVVIRTLIIHRQKFEFQVGGAITFDSDPKAELAEIFDKAKAINKLLGTDIYLIKFKRSLNLV